MDNELSAEDLKELVAKYKEVCSHPPPYPTPSLVLKPVRCC